jgi:hypothetical protein
VRLDEAEAALYSMLSENWVTTPLAWRNVDARLYTNPSLPLLPDGDTDYVSVQIDVFGGRTVTVPGNCVRYSGQLVLAVCVQENSGTRQARTYQSDLQGLLENKTIRSSKGTLRLTTLSNSVDYFTDNGWYVLETTIPFYFERYLTPATVDVGV